MDTDKYKYPIGSGRVTFNNHKSFMRAVNAAFIEVKTAKFTKKIQVQRDKITVVDPARTLLEI